MANRHFAKLADVWKHLPLTEILSIDRPRRYWESHAGSGAYALSPDAERRYGAVTFVDKAPTTTALASSRYLHHLRALNPGAFALYPGSALLAVCELGSECAYTLCEIDGASAHDLIEWSARSDAGATVVQSDGNRALCDVLGAVDDARSLLVHVDPYDPWLAPDGISALDLAAAVAERGAGLVYWYGYSDPAQRAWAFEELRSRIGETYLWCGDVMVEGRDGPRVRADGDLGDATTPGTGFGIVTANVSRDAIAACGMLGAALSAAYANVPLPEGRPGRLDFVSRDSSVGAGC